MEGRAMTDLKEQTSSTVLKANRKEHMLDMIERGWVLRQAYDGEREPYLNKVFCIWERAITFDRAIDLLLDMSVNEIEYRRALAAALICLNRRIECLTGHSSTSTS